jgi:FtsH-binding integral membrane protein
MQPIPVMEDVVQEKSALSVLFLKVYSWMFLGLSLTAAVSLGIEFGLPGIRVIIIHNPLIFYGLLILELALVWGLSAAINRIPAIFAIFIFLAYAVINGITFSVIFMFFNLGSIFVTFAVTAGMFAGTSALGYITKMDLSKMGALLMMALIGLILASVANMFLNASGLEWIICFAGVIIFTGLTAWDTQKIKKWSQQIDNSSEEGNKASIMGALMLYLDFINMFLFLLRLLGRMRD